MVKGKKNILSRREFFKQAAKGILPILGFTILGSGALISCDKIEDITGSGCSDCSGGCENSCSDGCKTGCKGSCSSTCYSTCSTTKSLGSEKVIISNQGDEESEHNKN